MTASNGEHASTWPAKERPCTPTRSSGNREGGVVAKHIGTDRLLTVEAAADRKGDAERALVLIEAQIVADGAALIFQHQARGAEQAITSAIDGQIVAAWSAPRAWCWKISAAPSATICATISTSARSASPLRSAAASTVSSRSVPMCLATTPPSRLPEDRVGVHGRSLAGQVEACSPLDAVISVHGLAESGSCRAKMA